ncbi:hypothetical protein B0H11DRAFT_1924225 [Mycena galericulata]|nr:hypothetical protein B0H11DRAFT_1924225 [Mycena galericulata]
MSQRFFWMYLGHPARRRRDQKFAWGFPSSQVDPWHRSPKKRLLGRYGLHVGLLLGIHLASAKAFLCRKAPFGSLWGHTASMQTRKVNFSSFWGITLACQLILGTPIFTRDVPGLPDATWDIPSSSGTSHLDMGPTTCGWDIPGKLSIRWDIPATEGMSLHPKTLALEIPACKTPNWGDPSLGRSRQCINQKGHPIALLSIRDSPGCMPSLREFPYHADTSGTSQHLYSSPRDLPGFIVGKHMITFVYFL